MTTTHKLVAAVVALFAVDLGGGLLAVTADVNTWSEAWGSKALLAAPLPMIAFQALTTWLAVRRPGRPAKIASGLLAAACIVSVVSGFFDGGLGNEEVTAGLAAYQVLLLTVTGAVGVLALVRLRELRSRKPAPRRPIRLPGQSSVAEGPHDQSGMYVIHHAFRRDLAAFEAAVRATPVGDAETWRALRERWTRFAVTLHHHHGVEDQHLWPVLLQKTAAAGDTAGQRLLRSMEAEHEGIDPALAAVTDGFRAMVDHPCDDHRNALDVHVTTTREALLEHLAHEETEALPLLQRTLSAAENAAFEKAAERAYPVSMLPFLLPWVSAGLPDEVRKRIVEDAGSAYSLLLRVFRGKFERNERKAFRYV